MFPSVKKKEEEEKEAIHLYYFGVLYFVTVVT